MSDETRAPKPAPFPVGTKVRYVGTRKSGWVGRDGVSHPILYPGVVHEIVRVKPGRRGTGLVIATDEDGDEIIDRTQDAYSVWTYTDDSGREQGRVIWPADAHEWEIA